MLPLNSGMGNINTLNCYRQKIRLQNRRKRKRENSWDVEQMIKVLGEMFYAYTKFLRNGISPSFFHGTKHRTHMRLPSYRKSGASCFLTDNPH
jgi:MarR-like DNA-binding transcriptional regulator SgrR of sgrS sRNA